MKKKVVSGILLTLLLIGMLTLTFNLQPVKAEPKTWTVDDGEPVEHSEPPATEWNRTYGGIDLERAYSVVQTSDGGYALAGVTRSFGAGEDDMWLVKTDANGSMQWNKTYGGTERDLCNSVLQTADGGFILAGSTMSFGAGNWDIWLIKTDANGDLQWNKTFGGTGFDAVDGERSVVQTSDGGYAIAGYTMSFSPWGIWLIKTDANGEMQWNKTYELGWGAHSVVQTDDGGYALAGFAFVSSHAHDFLLLKTDSNGNMQWNKTYGGTDFDSAHSLVQTADSGYALTGGTRSLGAGEYDVWLVKTSTDGNMQWNRTYGGALIDEGRSLVQTSDGGFAIASRQYSFGAGNGDFWLIKTDSAGNMQWNTTYGGADTDLAFSVVETVDGGYALAGETLSFGAGQGDFWLVKVRPEKLSTQLYFNLNPNPASVGETLTLKGIFVDEFSQPLSNETVKLYARPLAGSWRYITSLTTNEYGIFMWKVTIPSVTGIFILAVYYPSSETYESSYNLAVLIVQ